MEETVCLDEAVLVGLALLFKKGTAYEIFCKALDVEKDTTKNDFNDTFSRLIKAGILIKKGHKFAMSKEFTVFLDELRETITPEHFSQFYPEYYTMVIDKVEYLNDEFYKKAIKKKFRKEKIKPRTAFILLGIGIASLAVFFAFILTAGLIQYTNRSLANIFGFSSFSFIIVSLVCFMKCFNPLMKTGINYKKRKYTEASIENIEINITPRNIENYFRDAKYQTYPEKGILFKASKSVSKIILNQSASPRPFPFRIASIKDNVQDVKKEVEDLIGFLHKSDTFSASSFTLYIGMQVGHRFAIIFLFKESVTEEDLKILEKYYRYEKVGEFPFSRAPIYFPVLYDKSKSTLIYKAAKIPLGFGSTLHAVLKELKKMLKKI